MDRAAAFLASIEAVKAGSATPEQAFEVAVLAELAGQAELAALARAILDHPRTSRKAA